MKEGQQIIKFDKGVKELVFQDIFNGTKILPVEAIRGRNQQITTALLTRVEPHQMVGKTIKNVIMNEPQPLDVCIVFTDNTFITYGSESFIKRRSMAITNFLTVTLEYPE